MSDPKTIEFFVEKGVLDLGVKIIFGVIEGLDNSKESPEWQTERYERIKALKEKYADVDFHSDPVFEGFHVLHDRAGIKRRKNVPSSENLVKALNKSGETYYINEVVDIYNIISMESKLALGAHDIDKVSGNMTLRITDGTERFVPIGRTESLPQNPGEYSYCDDDNEILCRREIRQVEKTKVGKESRNVLYIVQGNDMTDDLFLRETAREIIETTVKYCGGKGRIVIPKVI